MKERPILFSGPMVRAILDGRKSQTRRVVKPQRHPFGDMLTANEVALEFSSGTRSVRCPYGQPGDRLWVRETFQPIFAEGVEYKDTDWSTGKGYSIRYVATDGITDWVDPDDNMTNRCKPSIHMPRWASRITLEITGVRVERLQEISEEDAKKEGIESEGGDPKMWKSYNPKLGWLSVDDPAMSYRTLWESINGPGSWDANPFVWVVEFKRLDGGR